MEENKIVPQLRFSGFCADWQVEKFSDITFLTGEKNRDNLPLESFSISNERGFVPQNEQFENGGTMKDADKRMYYIVTPKTFAYNPARINVGSIGYYDLEKNVIVSSLYEVFKTSDTIDDRFLWHWFKSDAFKKMIEQYQEGGVRLYFYYDKLCKCVIPVPDILEQKSIGAILDTIDQIILMHKQKYNKLCNTKEAMLEKMFPKGDEIVPKVRFKEFSDVWKKCKVGDFLTESRIIGNTGLTAKKLTVKLWGKGVVEKSDAYGGSAHTQYYVRKAGQFMYGKLDFLHAAFGIVPDSLDGYESTLDSPAFDLSGIDGRFLMNTVIQENFYLKNGMIANGSRKAKRIHADTFLEMDILAPTIEEQEKIGDYFSQLDKQIYFAQLEIDKLENLKKALLEKMFV